MQMTSRRFTTIAEDDVTVVYKINMKNVQIRISLN